MATQPDYYEVLQVHTAAEPEVIQAAYRRLSLKYHPDVYKGADTQHRMTMFNQAYAVLGDATRRAAYDRQRSGGSSPRAARATPSLHVQSRAVDFGAVPLDRNRTISVRIKNAGQGKLSGLVTSHVPWLRVTPTEFDGNELDIILRFHPSLSGEYQSSHAVEVYSNGGRATIAVQASVRTSTERDASPPRPAAPGREGPVVNRRPMQLSASSQRHVGVPFMAWVTLGTLVSSVVWFQIAPVLTVVPLGFGLWLAWQRFVAGRNLAQVGQSAERTPRRATLTRCRTCSSTLDPGRANRCPRCGGSICASCGSCPCRVAGARARSSP